MKRLLVWRSDMARVIVSKEARNDLVSIRDYIRDELCNPDAAQRLLAALKKSILSLEHFPGRGKPLDTLTPVHTEYRHLLCERLCHNKWLIFDEK